MKLDRYKNHDVEVVIDKLVVAEKDDRRLKQSVATAMRQGDGLMMILDAQSESINHYSGPGSCVLSPDCLIVNRLRITSHSIHRKGHVRSVRDWE